MQLDFLLLFLSEHALRETQILYFVYYRKKTELSVLCFLNPRSDVNRQALFTNVNYSVGTSACHCFVHCINDKCVFMQITYFLKIIIFSSIQHL